MKTLIATHSPFCPSDAKEELGGFGAHLKIQLRRYLSVDINELPSDATNLQTFPIYAYIHGGIAFSASPFSCSWDSGVAGFVTLPKDEHTDLRIRAMISALNAFYNNDNYYIGEEHCISGRMSDLEDYAEEMGCDIEFLY